MIVKIIPKITTKNYWEYHMSKDDTKEDILWVSEDIKEEAEKLVASLSTTRSGGVGGALASLTPRKSGAGCLDGLGGDR